MNMRSSAPWLPVAVVLLAAAGPAIAQDKLPDLPEYVFAVVPGDEDLDVVVFGVVVFAELDLPVPLDVDVPDAPVVVELRDERLVVGAELGAGPGWLQPADIASAGLSAWNQMSAAPTASTAITTSTGQR